MGLLGKPTILGNPYTDLDRKIMVIAIILKEVARPLRYSWDINPTDSLGMSRHLELKHPTPHVKCDHHLKKLTICSHFFLMSAFGSTVGLKKFLAGGWTNQPIWKNRLIKLERISPNFPGSVKKYPTKNILKKPGPPTHCPVKLTSFFQIDGLPRPSKCSFPVCSPPGAASCEATRFDDSMDLRILGSEDHQNINTAIWNCHWKCRLKCNKLSEKSQNCNWIIIIS